MDLVLLIISCFLALAKASAPENSIRTVWCVNENIRSQRNLLTGIKEKDMICEAKTINRYPFTSGEEITPPRPEGMNLEYKTYNTDDGNGNNSTQIAIYVTWTYRVGRLDYVQSFHIELSRCNPSCESSQFVMTWDRNQTLVPGRSSGLVTFGFIYCGTPGDYHISPTEGRLNPENYTFTVQANPIYHEKDDPQIVEKFIIIPDCNNELISKTQHCVSRRRSRHNRGSRNREDMKKSNVVTVQQKLSTKDTGNRNRKNMKKNNLVTTQSKLSTAETESDPMQIAFLMLGGIMIIVVAVAAAWICKKKINYPCFWNSAKTQAVQQDKRQVLLICSSDNTFLKPINQLVDLFANFTNVEITCNLHHSNEIGEQGIPEWTKKKINNADVTAFLIANPCDVQVDDNPRNSGNFDQVGIVLKAVEKIIVGSEKDYENKKFIIVDLKNSKTNENFPLFQRYKFPRDFAKFTKLITGGIGQIDAGEKDIFLHSLEIAKLGGFSLKTTLEQQKETCDEVKVVNNLDHPLQPSTSSDVNADGRVLCPQNIPNESRPPSLTSNRSELEYVTTDCNENPAHLCTESGARPKVRC